MRLWFNLTIDFTIRHAHYINCCNIDNNYNNNILTQEGSCMPNSIRAHITSKLAGAAGDARSSWKVIKELLHSDERHTESDAAVNQNICDGFCKFFSDKLANDCWQNSGHRYIWKTPTSCTHHPGCTYQLLLVWPLAMTIWYVQSTTYYPNRLHLTSFPIAFSRAEPTFSARWSPD